MRISDWSSDVCSSYLPNCEGEGYTAEKRKAEPVDDRKFRPAPLGNVDGEPDPSLFSVLFEKAEGNLFLIEVQPSRHEPRAEIGRASGRGRVGQYVSIWVVGVSIKKKTDKNYKK